MGKHTGDIGMLNKFSNQCAQIKNKTLRQRVHNKVFAYCFGCETSLEL
jgi:hypothetical protein